MSLTPNNTADYAAQLAVNVQQFKESFAPFALPEPLVHASAPQNYRLRAEFRMWHQGAQVFYAMFDPARPKHPVIIDEFAAADTAISALMPRLRAAIEAAPVLKEALFQINFLATLSGEKMATLIYHRRLDADWEVAARALAKEEGVQIVGRSRKQKIVLERDWLLESFELGGRTLRYQQREGAFTQPNGGVNRQMLAWACQQTRGLGSDLLELYCGNGNFTIALAPYFERVLATEMSHSSVQAARYNLTENAVDNVFLARMSSDEISAALSGGRLFNRLQETDLPRYRFSTLFVDPPRSGLDAATLALAARFDHILYISCQRESLLDNVTALFTTHTISASAVFDQFPYTPHLECGLLLSRRKT